MRLSQKITELTEEPNRYNYDVTEKPISNNEYPVDRTSLYVLMT